MNVSDQLLDLLTIRQLLLERIIAGENVAMNKQLDSVAQDIVKALKGKELSEYQGKRLDKAITELVSLVKVNPPDLAGIAASEASFINGAFASVGIESVIPAASTVTAIAQSAVIQGGTMGEWFGQLNETTRFNISRAVKNGVSLGLTNAQIAKSIMGKGDKGSEPIAKTRRDAMAITRTATQTVANDVRMASYMENADIIKAVQWVSTLDSRTSDICIARSGKTWTFPEFKPIGHSIPWDNGPPAHWACRSTSIPVTRSMAEITGKAEDQIAPRTRASMDGQVAQNLTFDQFLKNKPPEFADEMLGKGRAELWRSGKITLNQLLDQRGNPLTLAQLQSRYGSVAASTAKATSVARGIPVVTPNAVINAPAFNPAVNEESIKVISRKDVQKILTTQFQLAAQNPAYDLEGRIVFKGIQQGDIGKSNLSTGFTDEAMSMILAIKPELDDLADRFNIPKIRGFKTSTASTASMGDGIMTLHPEYFSGFASKVGGKASSNRIDALKTVNAGLLEKIRPLGEQIADVTNQLRLVERNSEKYTELWWQKTSLLDEYSKLASTYNKNEKLIKVGRSTEFTPSTWKLGDDPASRPYGVDLYASTGTDRARTILYHEFAHHIHQMYKKTERRSMSKPPIEARLTKLWATKTKAARDAQPSRYSNKDQYEWFAENFALYMMGNRKLVDDDLIKLIEEMLGEQANR